MRRAFGHPGFTVSQLSWFCMLRRHGMPNQVSDFFNARVCDSWSRMFQSSAPPRYRRKCRLEIDQHSYPHWPSVLPLHFQTSLIQTNGTLNLTSQSRIKVDLRSNLTKQCRIKVELRSKSGRLKVDLNSTLIRYCFAKFDFRSTLIRLCLVKFKVSIGLHRPKNRFRPIASGFVAYALCGRTHGSRRRTAPTRTRLVLLASS